MYYMSRGYCILIIQAVLVCGLCPKMNSCLSFVRHLHLGVIVKTPLNWALQKVFLNMVMTFVLHPLPHYNSITEPRAQFLLSIIGDLTINFSFHFILSLRDVYKDMVTGDKFIFPSAITRIIPYAFMSYLESAHFTIMGAISSASVRRSEAQLRPK